MLHAEIRTDRDAFHFFGEVNGYNLETLRQHVRETALESGTVHLRLEIDRADASAFNGSAAGWLSRLADRGAFIEINVRRH
ncbi:MAG TPA: hypothetical protein VMW17_00750 [Candidatus Binatia bacterium]|nr:hypothetical protein [Candidatus Binatia bacterium]